MLATRVTPDRGRPRYHPARPISLIKDQQSSFCFSPREIRDDLIDSMIKFIIASVWIDGLAFGNEDSAATRFQDNYDVCLPLRNKSLASNLALVYCVK